MRFRFSLSFVPIPVRVLTAVRKAREKEYEEDDFKSVCSTCPLNVYCSF